MRCEFCERKVNVLRRGLCNMCVSYLEDINYERGEKEERKGWVIIVEIKE